MMVIDSRPQIDDSSDLLHNFPASGQDGLFAGTSCTSGRVSVRVPVCVALLLALSGGFRSAEAQAIATFKSSVNLVPISASVRDRHGKLVTKLSANDFEVFDKGERRKIVDFQVDGNAELSLAVLVDVSGSMRIGGKLAIASDVLNSLSLGLRDGRDEIALFTFDDGLEQQQPFTRHPAQVRNAIASAEPFGTTSLYDAIAQTAKQLAARPAPRRAIVVVTDGIDTSSRMKPAEVSAIAASIDVPVYVVVAVPPADRAAYQANTEVRTAQAVQVTGDVGDLARWTGGDLVSVTTATDAALRISDVLGELRQQYLIAIESSADLEWRPLDLHVRDRSLRVRARSGYFGKGTADPQ